MSMVRITVPPQDTEVVVTFSPEYGFTVAGGEAKTEEIEPRNLVMAPVLDLPMMADQPNVTQLPDHVQRSMGGGAPKLAGPTDCANCDHPYHEDECMVPVKDAKGVPCGCVNWIPS